MNDGTAIPFSPPRPERSAFLGFENLIGQEGMQTMQASSVCIIGLGGVGSWVAEGLARSGVGKLTLVDLDDVCITNMNRQVQALHSTIGRSKTEVLGERLRDIAPALEVQSVERFFSATNAEQILSISFDVIVDCIDRVTNKSLLISMCVERKIPLVCIGSAGDRLDPTAIRTTDLALAEYDSLLSYVRKRLRQKHGFPRKVGTRFGVRCISSPKPQQPKKEQPTACADTSAQESDEQCASPSPNRAHRRLWYRSCNEGLGSAAFVTGAFGFAAAAEVVRIILSGKCEEERRTP